MNLRQLQKFAQTHRMIFKIPMMTSIQCLTNWWDQLDWKRIRSLPKSPTKMLEIFANPRKLHHVQIASPRRNALIQIPHGNCLVAMKTNGLSLRPCCLLNTLIFIIGDRPTTALDVTIQAEIISSFAGYLPWQWAFALFLTAMTLVSCLQVRRIPTWWIVRAVRVVEERSDLGIINDLRHPSYISRVIKRANHKLNITQVSDLKSQILRQYEHSLAQKRTSGLAAFHPLLPYAHTQKVSTRTAKIYNTAAFLLLPVFLVERHARWVWLIKIRRQLYGRRLLIQISAWKKPFYHQRMLAWPMALPSR